MKKILYTTIMYFLFTVLFTNVVNANFDDSVDGKQIFKTEVLPSKMGPKSVIEFISDAHTHKNVMIVGKKNVQKESNQAAIKQKIIDIKSYFGIDHHHLERILD